VGDDVQHLQVIKERAICDKLNKAVGGDTDELSANGSYRDF
jgi:hypothetical protein